MQIQEALWKVMKWSLGVQVLCLEGVILLSISCSCTHVWPLFAVCLVVYLNKHNIDNDVFKLILDSSVTLLCGCFVNLYHTQS